jgi:hypothetical protein
MGARHEKRVRALCSRRCVRSSGFDRLGSLPGCFDAARASSLLLQWSPVQRQEHVHLVRRELLAEMQASTTDVLREATDFAGAPSDH